MTVPTMTERDAAVSLADAAEAAAEAATHCGLAGVDDGHAIVTNELRLLRRRVAVEEGSTHGGITSIVEYAAGTIERQVGELHDKPGAVAVVRAALLQLGADSGHHGEREYETAMVWSMLHPDRPGAFKAALVMSSPSGHVQVHQGGLAALPRSTTYWNGSAPHVTTRAVLEEVAKAEADGWVLDCSPTEIQFRGWLNAKNVAAALHGIGHPLPGWA